MAVPMVILFEVAILIASVHDKRKARRKAEERAASHLEDDEVSPLDPIPEAIAAREESWSETT
jgi:sec-independent protein translocase protein TatC